MIIALPKGDLDQEDTSRGFGIAVGRVVARNVIVFGGYRSINISTERANTDDPDAPATEYTLGHRDLLVGVRYSWAVESYLDWFGEFHLARATLLISHADFAQGDEPVSISGPGFGLRGGLIARFGKTVGVGAAIGYSWTAIDVGGRNLGTFDTNASIEERIVEDNWLTYDLFAHIAF